MKLRLFKYTLSVLVLTVFFNRLVELSDITVNLKYFSFVKLNAVYTGSSHEKIEVLATDMEDTPRLNLSDLDSREEVGFVSHSMAKSLLDKFVVPNCRLSTLYNSINALLYDIFLYEKQKCILKSFESKYNERRCSTLGRRLYILRGCRGLKRKMEKLEASMEELKERAGQLERYILGCFLAAIKMLWKEGREQEFALIEESVEECTYDKLFSTWQELQLLKKSYKLFESFITSDFGKLASKSSSKSCFSRKNLNEKCEKYAFERFVNIFEKVEAQISSLTTEFEICASYLALNGIFNDDRELKSANDPTSLIGSLGSLLI
ncbi:uncharacterized protein ELE39_001003 [Cryptosporidium sp. chipmunk genotype I]|uniref:uncharacterized protein n=1 Tax=Cryptosporidium sp. chipmunk genotype I TaxID=1280935 RepID=UPI00351A2517|nr:hypothetical protein ELE39_001003 [Cryptosporidium sp. chipmunk genotype I]